MPAGPCTTLNTALSLGGGEDEEGEEEEEEGSGEWVDPTSQGAWRFSLPIFISILSAAAASFLNRKEAKEKEDESEEQ